MAKKNESICGVVEAIGSSGEGIIRHEGVTFFVPACLPQEKVRFKVLKIKGNVGYGKVEEVLTPAEERVRPVCPVFMRCGGCTFQHLEYGKQLIPLLEELGWTYDGKADFGVRWFLKKCNGDVRTHFIHIENRNDRIWQNHIIFRDYLNANPDKVKEYSNIKETIEKEYADNRQGYAAIKDPFIENTIQQALKEWNIKRVGEDYEL
jgi:predicted RNA-binding protein with TRAM domain